MLQSSGMPIINQLVERILPLNVILQLLIRNQIVQESCTAYSKGHATALPLLLSNAHALLSKHALRQALQCLSFHDSVNISCPNKLKSTIILWSQNGWFMQSE